MNTPLQYVHPVLQSRELKQKPVQVRLADVPYVLYRDASGQPQALLDRCPHRFAPLSGGKVRPDGHLVCPYHGWHFDAQGCGQSATQPTLNCQVPVFPVVEKYDFLWLAAPGSSPTIPDLNEPDFLFAGGLTSRFEAPLHVALDNFCEDEHTPFVHSRLGWSEKDLAQVEFESHNHPDHTEVHYKAPQRPTWLGRFFLKPGDIFHNSWRTYFDPARILYHIYWTDPSRQQRRDLELIVHIYFVPWDEKSTRVHALMFRKELPSQFLRPIFSPILNRIMCHLVRLEVEDDATFVRQLADTPFEMRGMRLGKFDKPLVHNHKLLKQIYWGQSADEEDQAGKEPANSNGVAPASLPQLQPGNPQDF